MGRDSDGRALGRHLRLATPGAALAIGVLIVAMLATTGVLSSIAHQHVLSGLGQVALFLSFAVVGVIVAWHQPRNPMGWVLLGVLFFFLLDDLASSYAYLDYRLHGGRLPLGWPAVLLAPSWAPAVVLAGLSLLLFPDGRGGAGAGARSRHGVDGAGGHCFATRVRTSYVATDLPSWLVTSASQRTSP